MISKSTQSFTVKNLSGGLATRPTPLIIEQGTKGAMLSPDLKNVTLFPTGGIAKRAGKTQQGNDLSVTAYSSDTGESSTLNFTGTPGAQTAAVAFKFTSGGAATISSISAKISINAATGTSATVICYFCPDSGGAPPGSFAGCAQIGQQTLNYSTTPALVTFSGGTTYAALAATTYWVAFVFPNSTPAQTLYYKGTTSGSKVSTSTATDTPTWVTTANSCYYLMYSDTSSTAVTGVKDYRYSSALTRQQVVTFNGNIYKRDKTGSNFDNTWTSLSTAFTVGQNYLSSFATLKELLFVANYGQTAQRMWNGSTAYTPKQGFQATFAAADNNSAGTVPNGVYKILAVTTLASGGYRASAEVSVTMAGGGTQQIAISSIVMDGTAATDFGFDIAATATKWFMTDAGASIYYKIPAANMSVANPAANSTTSFNITATTSLTAANQLIDEYSLPQAYFTSQIATPQVNYMEVFTDFFVMAGNSTYPSRVWFSEQFNPNIWSTYGQTLGSFIDVDAGDGDVITGLFQWNGSLYVAKQHSIHIIEFTGNAALPFQRRKLPGDIGALSGFTFNDIGDGFIFLSERGIAKCFGTIVGLAPGSPNIQDYFDPNDSNRFNLAVCQYSTAGINRTYNQVWFGVASTGSTNRDQVLVYDYERNAFWIDDGISGNYFTEVGDANSFFSVWSGDYSGQVFQHDSGTTDDGVAIDWYFYTPWISVGEPTNWKQFKQLYVRGIVQSSGTLSVGVYTDFSTTVTKTLSFDMTSAQFKAGISIDIGVRAKVVQLKFYNAASGVLAQVDSFSVNYNDTGFGL